MRSVKDKVLKMIEDEIEASPGLDGYELVYVLGPPQTDGVDGIAKVQPVGTLRTLVEFGFTESEKYFTFEILNERTRKTTGRITIPIDDSGLGSVRLTAAIDVLKQEIRNNL